MSARQLPPIATPARLGAERPAWAEDRSRSAVILVTVAAVLVSAVAAAFMLGSVPVITRQAGAATSTSTSCGSKSFYTPPSPLPKGTPGSVIRWRTGCDYLDSARTQKAPAKVWNLLYRSTNATGKQIAVSGTVLVPTAAWTGSGPRPLVAYATGTQGWGNQCAPTREMAKGNYDENFAVENLLNQG